MATHGSFTLHKDTEIPEEKSFTECSNVTSNLYKNDSGIGMEPNNLEENYSDISEIKTISEERLENTSKIYSDDEISQTSKPSRSALDSLKLDYLSENNDDDSDINTETHSSGVSKLDYDPGALCDPCFGSATNKSKDIDLCHGLGGENVAFGNEIDVVGTINCKVVADMSNKNEVTSLAAGSVRDRGLLAPEKVEAYDDFDDIGVNSTTSLENSQIKESVDDRNATGCEEIDNDKLAVKLDDKLQSVDIDSDSQMRTAENSDCDVVETQRKNPEPNVTEFSEQNMHASIGDGANVSENEQRRQRRPRVPETSSDSDLFDDTKSADSSASDDERNKTSDNAFVRKFPPNKWRAIPELQRREVGLSNRTPSSMFRERIMGSLRMVQRLTLMHKMEYHQGCVNTLNFNRIGTLLASGSDDLNIVLWNWVQSKPALIYDSGHRGNVFQAKFMPFSGDCHIVSCARDGQVRLAELSLTGVCKATKKVAQHKSSAHKLALEYDSPHTFLSCGEDGIVMEIDLREEKPHKLLSVKEAGCRVPLYSIHTNPVSSLEFCVSGLDPHIRVYDKRKIGGSDDELDHIKKFCPHHLLNCSSKANVTCAVYNYNGTEIVGTYNDESIYLFDTSHSTGADYIHKYEGHRNNSTVKGVNFYGPKSEYVTSGSDCGNLYFWDKSTEAIVQYLHADDTGVVNVSEPHPFAPVLATSGLDSDVKVWAPIAQDATSLSGIHKVTRKNRKNREYRDSTDLIDSQILLFLMRQSARGTRRGRAANDDTDTSSNDDSGDNSEESDDDDEGFHPVHLLGERTRCAPS